MRGHKIEIRVSAELLKKINVAAAAHFSSRSGFIRDAVIMRLNEQYLARSPGTHETLELLRRAGRQKKPGL